MWTIGVEPYVLPLRDVWTTSHSSSSARTNALIRAALAAPSSGPPAVGHGEVGLPPKNAAAGYHADYGDVEEYVQRARADIARHACADLASALAVAAAAVRSKADRQAHSGLEAALLDAAARLEGRPVRALLLERDDAAAPTAASGATELAACPGFLTVGLAEPGRMGDGVVRAFRQTPYIKLKLDGDVAAALRRLAAVRDALSDAQRARVVLALDANAAWTAAGAAGFLDGVDAALGAFAAAVRFLEQPFAADMPTAVGPDADLERSRWVEVRRRCAARGWTVFADESVATAEDLPALRPFVDGINVKLEKAGGIVAARGLLRAAAAQGLFVWVGSMVGSRLLMNIAAQALPVAGRGDLDGASLVTEDSQLFSGGFVWHSEDAGPSLHGCIELPGDHAPGFGVLLKERN